MSSGLPVPKAKRNVSTPRSAPFPVPISSLTGLPASNMTWKYFHGVLCDDSVIIERQEEAKTLYSMGYFGKGDLSRSGVTHSQHQTDKGVEVAFPNVISHRKLQLHRRWEAAAASEVCEEDEEVQAITEPATREVLVVSDSDSEDNLDTPRSLPHKSIDPYPVQEKLHLILEEAYFLSYGLGCLIVRDDSDVVIGLDELWQHCQAIHPNFVSRYVCYHNFRSKGWVVKPGIKFGVEFLLYKQGPPFFHATYAVLISLVDEATLCPVADQVATNDLSWSSLAGIHRTVQHVGKELLMCYVIRPSDLTFEDVETPACISKFKVQEILIRRWVATQERESEEIL